MHKRFKLLFFLFFFWSSVFTVAYAEWAKVKYVIDGDTIILENNQRIRLVGIDAPEVKSKHKSEEEYCGKESKQFLHQLIAKKKIWLESEEAQLEYDKYGRRLAYIFSEDKTFINRELVRLGYAEAIRYFPYKYKEEFRALEKDARNKALGMWRR